MDLPNSKEELVAEGQRLLYLGRFDEALAKFSSVFAVGDEQRNSQFEGEALFGAAKCFEGLGEFCKASDYCERAINSFELVGKDPCAYDLEFIWGYFLMLAGDTKLGVLKMEKHVQKMKQLNNFIGVAALARFLAKGYDVAGKQECAIEILESAAPLLINSGRYYQAGCTLTHLGVFWESRRDYNTAEGKYRQAIDTFKKLESKDLCYLDLRDFTRNYGMSLVQLGLIEANRGMLDQAEGAFLNALALYKRTDDSFCIAKVLVDLADIAIRQGRHEKAMQMLMEAVQISEVKSFPLWKAKALISRGNLMFLLKDNEKARIDIIEAERICRELGKETLVGECHRILMTIGKTNMK